MAVAKPFYAKLSVSLNSYWSVVIRIVTILSEYGVFLHTAKRREKGRRTLAQSANTYRNIYFRMDGGGKLARLQKDRGLNVKAAKSIMARNDSGRPS